LIPVESRQVSAAVLILLLDEDGAVLDELVINLGTLGFRPDVDGLWTNH
jgi:hypothetical protein